MKYTHRLLSDCHLNDVAGGDQQETRDNVARMRLLLAKGTKSHNVVVASLVRDVDTAVRKVLDELQMNVKKNLRGSNIVLVDTVKKGELVYFEW